MTTPAKPFKPAKKLGFGLMRLPVDGNKKIDEPQVSRMTDAFLERGFTYFDTAYVYHGGDSERVIKRALVDRYPRDSFTLATKLPGWMLNKQADVQRIFDEQLKRTGVDYFDYYLLHSIETNNKPNYDQFKCWEWGLKMKEQGLIRHFGFSFHDSATLLDTDLAPNKRTTGKCGIIAPTQKEAGRDGTQE